jgi:Zn-dependent peptidase ImmA (M78 family)
MMSKTFKGLPKKIKIGQRSFKIHTRREEHDPMLSVAYAYTMTQYDHIVIRSNMSVGQARTTLMHELLHAIGIVYGNPSSVVDKDDDEEDGTQECKWEHYFINMYEEPVVAMLRDNPELVAFMTAEDK